MLLSIILPCYNEELYISKAIDSVIANVLDKEAYELIIVDGNSSDKTFEIANNYKQKHENIQILKNVHRTVPYAMNMAIKQAQGEYIIRIDAHCEYPEDYFRILIDKHNELNADNVGCVIETKALHDNRKSKSIVSVLSDVLGVGNSYFRVGIKEVKEVDTVPFGCYKKSYLEEIGLYDERLAKSQDIELNKRIKRKGGRIFLLPEPKLVYYARESFSELGKKYIANGMWNILVAKYTKTLNSLSFRNYVPFIFVVLFLANISTGIASSVYRPISLVFTALYFLTIFIRSLQLKNQKNSVFYMFFTFIVLHFSHGIGAVKGFFKQFFLKSELSNE